MPGRPGTTEATPQLFTYIDLVPGDDALPVLDRQLEECLAYFATIDEDRSRHRYAPDKWSIRQVLNHVTDIERVFTHRAFWFARGFDAPLPGFEQDIAADGADADRLPWATHVAEFRCVRLATLALFRNMPEAAWTRAGIASDHPVTVRALAFATAGHLTHHRNVLRERYA